MPDTLLLRNCTLYDSADPAARRDVLLRDGRIEAVAPGLVAPGDTQVVDAGGRLLIPGLIDLHVHGAGGADVLDGDAAALATLARTLARLGTTSFLGTTFLQPATGSRHLRVAAESVGRDLGGAQLLGLHLEGPFVNPKRRGGLPADCIQPASSAALQEVLALTGGALRMMTIAPEPRGALGIIERLAGLGVIPSFGHSDATYDETRLGLAAGIRHATHLYNAMPGLHHRAPGPLVALCEADGLTVQLISDDVHVDRHVVRWTYRVFGADRCACITDGMRTAGLPDGRYVFGAKEFESADGAARYLDGTLIGTSLSLRQVMLRFRDYTGCTLALAVDAASRVPAAALGIADRKGAIRPGMDADLVLLDADLEVRATLVAGRLVYTRGAPASPASP